MGNRDAQACADLTLVIGYQSESFRSAMPESTRNLEEWGLGDLRWVEPIGSAESALRPMREQMLHETNPVAGVFIGGMEGIKNEAAIFRQICEGRPLYFLGAPGGAAQELAEREPVEFTPISRLTQGELRTSRSYPALLQRIVLDIAARL
jgi:hypothetical protein